MADLHPLEATNGNPKVGGFVISFPSGAKKVVHWVSGAPIKPEEHLEAAKEYAAAVVAELIKEGLQDDVNRTNWASCVAAIQKIVSDWSAALTARLHADAPTVQ